RCEHPLTYYPPEDGNAGGTDKGEAAVCEYEWCPHIGGELEWWERYFALRDAPPEAPPILKDDGEGGFIHETAPEAESPEPAPSPGAATRNGAAPASTTPLRFHVAGNVVQAEEESARYRVPGVVADGAITAYGGSVGHGKTPSLIYLIAAMLNGGEWLGI